SAPWRAHHPYMSRMLWIDIAFVVLPIHRARDHAHVALVLRVCFPRRSWRCLVRRLARRSLAGGGSLGSGRFLAFFLLLFREVLAVRIARERDVFSVRRPNRTASTSRQIGKHKRIATGHWQHCKLWRFRLAIFFGGAQEQQKFSVLGPARGTVVIA